MAELAVSAVRTSVDFLFVPIIKSRPSRELMKER
jgi:hypothetical protein